MTSLIDVFTKLQTAKLEEASLKSIYDFITCIPYKIDRVVPLKNINTQPEENSLYLWEGRLSSINPKKSQNRFMVLDFIGEFSLRCYLFSVANYTLKVLKIGQPYQLLLKFKDGFWSIEKFALSTENIASSLFTLGKAQIQKYYLPRYNKLGDLYSKDFIQLHKRLDKSNYLLNLKGLIPENQNLIPQFINLYNLHHPKNFDDYFECLSQWTSLKVFLKLSLINYLTKAQEDKHGKIAVLDKTYLQQTISKLPFRLSQSQQQTIVDILGDIGSVSQPD